MKNFKIVKKGYDSLEVDNYLLELEKQHEKVVSALRDTITQMKEKNDNLYILIEGYKEREDSVNKALAKAIESANEIEFSAKIKFVLESEKINDFSNKWTYFCKTQLDKIDTKINKQMEEYLDTINKEFQMLSLNQINKDHNIEIPINTK